MAWVDSGRWPEADLLEMMDGFLTRQNERDLFGLDDAAEEEGDRLAEKQRGGKQKTGERPGQKATAGTKARAKAKKLPEPDDDLAREFKL